MFYLWYVFDVANGVTQVNKRRAEEYHICTNDARSPQVSANAFSVKGYLKIFACILQQNDDNAEAVATNP